MMDLIEIGLEIAKMAFGIVLGMWIVEKWFLKRQINGVIKQITNMREFKELSGKIKEIDVKKINEIIENIHELLKKGKQKPLNNRNDDNISW